MNLAWEICLSLLFGTFFCIDAIAQSTDCQKSLRTIKSIRAVHLSATSDNELTTIIPSSIISSVDPIGQVFTKEDFKELAAVTNIHLLSNADSLCVFQNEIAGIINKVFRKRLMHLSNLDTADSQQFNAIYCLQPPTCLSESDTQLDQRLSSQIGLSYRLFLIDSGSLSLTKASFFQKVRGKLIRDIEFLQNTFDASNLTLQAVSMSLDPHTNYFSDKNSKMFNRLFEDKSENYGFQLGENYYGELRINEIIPGTTVWREPFVKPGIVVKSIGYCNEVPIQAFEISKRELLDMMGDKSHNCLELELLNSDQEVRKFQFEKESINQNQFNVSSYILGKDQKIGYIPLKSFYSSSDLSGVSNGSAADFTYELIQIKRESINGLIIDLRDNSGGSLFEAQEIAGALVHEGKLASVKIKDDWETIRDRNRGRVYTGPVLVLINSGSASAAEFLAGVLRDKGVAVIAGQRSFGKGSMQLPYHIDQNGSLIAFDQYNLDHAMVKVTDGLLFTTSGRSYQKNGIVPDVVLDFDLIDYPVREDLLPYHILDQEDRADEKANFLVDEHTMDQLNTNHGSLFDEVYIEVKQQRVSMPISIHRDTGAFTIALQDPNSKESSWIKPDITLEGRTLLVRNSKHREQILNTYGKSTNDTEHLDQLRKDLYIQASYQLMLDIIQIINQNER